MTLKQIENRGDQMGDSKRCRIDGVGMIAG